MIGRGGAVRDRRKRRRSLLRGARQQCNEQDEMARREEGQEYPQRRVTVWPNGVMTNVKKLT